MGIWLFVMLLCGCAHVAAGCLDYTKLLNKDYTSQIIQFTVQRIFIIKYATICFKYCFCFKKNVKSNQIKSEGLMAWGGIYRGFAGHKQNAKNFISCNWILRSKRDYTIKVSIIC